MTKNNEKPEIIAEPQKITAKDRVRLKEMLSFILSGTYFEKDEEYLTKMMKSDARVACLKLIENMIVVNKTVDNNHICDFFEAYLNDTKLRMKVKCKITNEFRCFDFSIGKKMGMKFCLIIGELVTNSLKHGISARRRKMPIMIAMGNDPKVKKWFNFLYMDEGLGINENLDMHNKEQYGLSIAHSIITSLEGEFDISTFDEGGVGIECKIDNNNLKDFYS
jgi:two-component sensor histidine kinase